jgi:hypothetical protein
MSNDKLYGNNYRIKYDMKESIRVVSSSVPQAEIGPAINTVFRML